MSKHGEWILGLLELCGFVLSGYQFMRIQRKQIIQVEFIEFIQKAIVFNPGLLKLAMDNNAPSIYHKSFHRFQEDLHFARGVGLVQGFVECNMPIRSILNQSSKLALSKLTKEDIFSNGELSNTTQTTASLDMCGEFSLYDSGRENSISLMPSTGVDYQKALHTIQSVSQIRSLTTSEKVFSWIIFVAKILLGPFGIGKNLKGVKVGDKSVERGIVVGQYLVAYGEIIFDRISRELRMDHPIMFLKDKTQMIEQLKKHSASDGKKMSLLFIMMTLFGFMVIRRLRSTIKNLWKSYQDSKERNRMQKVIEISQNLSLEYKCVICYENAKNVIIRPCLHLAVCKLCFGELKDPQCPMCRRPIESHVTIYIN
jgi:Zinc finger, C3HC4 type (RING finger)